MKSFRFSTQSLQTGMDIAHAAQTGDYLHRARAKLAECQNVSVNSADSHDVPTVHIRQTVAEHGFTGLAVWEFHITTHPFAVDKLVGIQARLGDPEAIGS